LTDTEPNLLILLFLTFHQDPDLYPEIVNGSIEFPVDAPSQTSRQCDPEFRFHNRQIVTNQRLPGKSFHPGTAFLYVFKELMNPSLLHRMRTPCHCCGEKSVVERMPPSVVTSADDCIRQSPERSSRFEDKTVSFPAMQTLRHKAKAVKAMSVFSYDSFFG
jgi:hypothetical protein